MNLMIKKDVYIRDFNMSYNTVLSYKKNQKRIEHFYQTIGEDWFTYPNLYTAMIEKCSQGGHFVEVGSWKGRSAAFMAVEINNRGLTDVIKFDCVDTWEGSVEHKDMEIIQQKLLYTTFLENVSSVLHVINPIRKLSVEASKLYEDNSLDFVFLDASHEYEDVLDDISAWLPKIKNGGILAGHDYGREDVNRAVNEYFQNKNFSISEDCWIYEKTDINVVNIIETDTPLSKVTLVTGLWDIGRSSLKNSWSRNFNDYLEKFKQLLQTPVNLIIYGDEELEKVVWQHRTRENTQFIKRSIQEITNNEFYEKIQSIRNNPSWYTQTGWLRDSTQSSLELYNPLVMSKMFLLNDARLLDKFDSEYMFWIDGGITNTVHYGYFTHQMMQNISEVVNSFSFVCFPYTTTTEIHGFQLQALTKYAQSTNVNKVARGGFFGGPTNTISEVNALYYGMLNDTLSNGYMGTEESIFTILLYKYPNLFTYFLIEDNGLLHKFFDDVGENIAKAKRITDELFEKKKIGLYIITFNSPMQVKRLLQSFVEADDMLLNNTQKYLLNNSTDNNTDFDYDQLCQEYGFEQIKKGNLGICGGRQFIAEHAEQHDLDFYMFFEDDMLVNSAKLNGTCKSGFRTYVPQLFNTVVSIMEQEKFDFLKFSFSEFYGENSIQWAWYNVPQSIRVEFWPEYNKLPDYGLDPNAPKTNFKNISIYNEVAYATGEIYYSNWPQIVSREGNKKMFLDTKWEHPYEQTWMSYMYQLTKQNKLNPAILLASPITHDRFDHYDGSLRKES